ncbi:MAG: dihydropteroate synthase [Bacteroidota bacterium]|nr:dihydropteroate synthase [Bacteroidota bacterium]
MDYTINVKGQLFSMDNPQVMGILNITNESFYPASRVQSEEGVRQRVKEIISEGGTMIDIGACSTNPYLKQLTTEEKEIQRLEMALSVIKDLNVHLPISIDTFRPKVARLCIEKYDVDMINDISGGESPEMFRVVAETGTPYILMSQKATLDEIRMEVASKVQQLRNLGQKDIILDPGFGFGKTMEQHFRLLSQIDRFSVLGLPVLVGFSRKRMIYQTIGGNADTSLNGTTVLDTIALMQGANILRVHDVKEAVESVELFNAMVKAKEN